MTRSVLVADDSISIHDAVQEALADFDVALEVVYDGEEAARFIEANPPDLVITDVHMPGKNGYEVATLAKEARSDLPVILLCGTFESFDNAAFENSRADACLKKPFVAADLIEHMTELLGPLPARAGAAEEEAEEPAVESVPAALEASVEEEPESVVEVEAAAADDGEARLVRCLMLIQGVTSHHRSVPGDDVDRIFHVDTFQHLMRGVCGKFRHRPHQPLAGVHQMG